jgi:hypothetical protein
MKKLALSLLLLFTVQAHAATRVFGLDGWLDNFADSSAGVYQIAAAARQIPGVVQVSVYYEWQTQDVANAIMAAPAGDRIVIYGYSCGANSATTIAYGINPHRKVDLAIIQESVWCGGFPLLGNVNFAQETYASGFFGCILTMGFGCKTMEPGPGFTGKAVYIDRPDLHPLADLDPNAQNDVLRVIAGDLPRSVLRRKPQVLRVIRHNGEHL